LSGADAFEAIQDGGHGSGGEGTRASANDMLSLPKEISAWDFQPANTS
jgi:hypothetical protein